MDDFRILKTINLQFGMERGLKDSKKNAYLYNQTVQSWLNSRWSFETELLSVSEKTPPVVGFSHFSEVS